ncbi:hypothetical protein HNY73_000149 [Argiope bruennichi]|uniref:Uncharacterized protein n=1 Tax=Argiope bruennichi TaxID=94029 RepID=A0A8T0FZQ6_ARGBR|nr:hypothetical protein HNY73_000149 [Argiope bruennichi]
MPLSVGTTLTTPRPVFVPPARVLLHPFSFHLPLHLHPPEISHHTLATSGGRWVKQHRSPAKSDFEKNCGQSWKLYGKREELTERDESSKVNLKSAQTSSEIVRN